MNSILDHIKQESIRKFGEVCDNPECNMHEKFCRCHKAEERANRRMDIIGRNGNNGEGYFEEGVVDYD